MAPNLLGVSDNLVHVTVHVPLEFGCVTRSTNQAERRATVSHRLTLPAAAGVMFLAVCSLFTNQNRIAVNTLKISFNPIFD